MRDDNVITMRLNNASIHTWFWKKLNDTNMSDVRFAQDIKVDAVYNLLFEYM